MFPVPFLTPHHITKGPFFWTTEPGWECEKIVYVTFVNYLGILAAAFVNYAPPRFS